jgi:hypothetical protein
MHMRHARRMPRGRAIGCGLNEPFENPLEEIPRAIEEYATAPAAATAELQPQRWTLREVLTGRCA